MFKFPFTNFHELNLDWILSVVKEAKEIFDNGRTDIDRAVSTSQEALAVAQQAASATIADGAVTTPKIADEAVTTIKIAPYSVTSLRLADNAVENRKIADSAVNTPKIADSAVTNAKIANGTIKRDKLHLPFEIAYIDIQTLADGGVQVNSATSGKATYETFLSAFVLGENNETVMIYTYNNLIYARVFNIDTLTRDQAVHTIRVLYRIKEDA